MMAYQYFSTTHKILFYKHECKKLRILVILGGKERKLFTFFTNYVLNIGIAYKMSFIKLSNVLRNSVYFLIFS